MPRSALVQRIGPKGLFQYRSADIACQAVSYANYSALRENDSPLLRIADLVRLTTGTTKRVVAHRTSTLVWSIGLAIDGL